MYLSDIYTIAVNLAGLPGMSSPAPRERWHAGGRRLIGNLFDETRLLLRGENRCSGRRTGTSRRRRFLRGNGKQ